MNLIQNTPFEINVEVLEAVEWAWANNKTFAKFPHAEKLDKIPFPDDWDNMDKLAKKGWVLKARELFQKNREIDGGLALKLQDLRTARSLAKLPTKAFWVGASWDFRGRVYPVANFSHQRGDHIKSMRVYNGWRSSALTSETLTGLVKHPSRTGWHGSTSIRNRSERSL